MQGHPICARVGHSPEESDFSRILECYKFVACNSWLQRFKERHDIGSRVLTDESQSAHEETATTWVQANIGPIVQKYGEKNV